MPANWLAVAAEQGRRAAHIAPFSNHPADAVPTQAGFERILAAWCRLRPDIRGDGVAFLCWVRDQALQAEAGRMAMARSEVRRAVQPMFGRLAPVEQIREQAQRTAGERLTGEEIEDELADTHSLVRFQGEKRA